MSLKKQTVLVTGAGGFVGGALARQLAADGVKVRALIRNRAKASYISDVENITIIDGDLENEISLRKAVEGCSVVFHVAAALGGSPDDQARVNVEGTRLLATAAASVGVNRFVHVSSIAIYGFADLPDLITEDTTPSASEFAYAATKRAGEGILKLVSVQTGLAYTIIRPGMIYGPRSNPWTVGMYKLTRRVIPFFGDGRGHVGAVHIDDVVSMCIVAADHPAAVNQAFNCAADPGVTWREYLIAYAKLSGHTRWLGIPVGLVRVLLPLIKPFAPAGSLIKDMPAALNHHLRPIVYTTAKAREKLGWHPKWDIQSGLADAVGWLKEQGIAR
jgi:nucleoside-diphosphate-sugar epimerase